MMPRSLELLAPAGDAAALQAALEAGADAVYFGLKLLNARRRAKNFSPEEFSQAVRTAHDRSARAYLTLNTDLTERELGQAARILEFARQCGVDAVLVRDPALLALRPEYPEMEFHFSTQSCPANGADVAAAAALGAGRVVLAREMTLDEITAASATPGVATEVFVQGALCYSVSGRCLLSSWIGGRSGNRGACTSPCRVPWSESETSTDTPFSMRDLTAIDRLTELQNAGVAALKIEGRLKNAAWVRRAVTLYRRALNGESGNELRAEAESLGDYTGRLLTADYLDGRRDRLTGLAEGRMSSPLPDHGVVSGEGQGEGGSDNPNSPHPNPFRAPTEGWSGEGTNYYDFTMTFEPKGIVCRCTCGPRTEEWTIPKTVVKRAHKAVSIGAFFERLERSAIDGLQLGLGETNDSNFLLVPRAVNALVGRIVAVVRRAQKSPEEFIRLDLPSEVRRRIEPVTPHAANRLALGQKPDRVRIEAWQAAAFLKHVQSQGLVVEGATLRRLPQLVELGKRTQVVIALPPVFFEEDIPEVRKLLTACKSHRLPVEVNSWGGWHLARAAGVTMEAGPGLPVLNSLAARKLGELGIRCVTLSPEADRRQFEAVTARCPVPCSLIVFGRPPLLTTRVQMPDRLLDVELSDRRGARLLGRRERGLTVFRPVEPFELRGSTNEKIRVKHLVVDLTGSPDPVADWNNVPLPGDRPFRFNYDRTLA
ncbi:MAG: U32 family peptidase [Pirellulales bacterium]|nr:U32 family peptidase [Pirellulales bacterium]